MKKRTGWHILFWLIYTVLYAYTNTAFASKSDLAYSTGVRFLRMWSSELMILPIKLVATYSFLYWLLPDFLLKKRYFQFLVIASGLLVTLLILYRLDLAYVIYPVLYDEYPGFNSFAFSRFIWAMLDVGGAVALASAVKLVKGRFESQHREQALINQKLQTELQFLRAQTNPHFLFNTLNNLYALARKQSELTAPAILKLSKLMRFILYECTGNTIPLSKEIQVVADYIELEKLRYGARLQINFHQRVDHPRQEIAPLLLLPFVENAFKHGAGESRFDIQIDINLSLVNQIFIFEIENSKDEFGYKKEPGLGLQNVRRQLELTYPGRHKLIIKEEEHLFKVYLKIDLSNAT